MISSQHFTFGSADFADTVAHQGSGTIAAARVLDREPGHGCSFIDLVVVPPGCSIGRHSHADDDEEVYVVVDGQAVMILDDRQVDVGPGDVVVNRPGGLHGLANRGTEPVRLVVVDVRSRPV